MFEHHGEWGDSIDTISHLPAFAVEYDFVDHMTPMGGIMSSSINQSLESFIDSLVWII